MFGLHRSNFQTKSLSPPPPHNIHGSFSGSVAFVMSYLCISHLFLIISPLIFQFSLLCRPPSLHPFLLPRLKRFTSPLSLCLATLPHPPTPFDSILISTSMFLHLFFSYPSSLSFYPATARILTSLCPLPPPLLLRLILCFPATWTIIPTQPHSRKQTPCSLIQLQIR